MSTTQRPPAKKAGAKKRISPAGRRVVRRNVVVRRIDAWSVLKLSLIFYFFALLVGMAGLVFFWSVLSNLAVIEEAIAFAEELAFEIEVDGANIARATFLLGLVNVVLLSGINVFLALLYNLVADVLGGLRMTFAEEE